MVQRFQSFPIPEPVKCSEHRYNRQAPECEALPPDTDGHEVCFLTQARTPGDRAARPRALNGVVVGSVRVGVVRDIRPARFSEARCSHATVQARIYRGARLDTGEWHT